MSFKDTTKKKAYIIPVLILNILGLICLVFFALMYFSNNQQILNPDTMLPFKVYEIGGVGLVFGILPLAVANLLLFFPLKHKGKLIGVLAFIPALICTGCAADYLYKDLSGMNVEPVSEDEIVLRIDLRTEDDVYSLSYKGSVDGQSCGTGAVCRADEKPFAKGEIIYLKYDKNMCRTSKITDLDLKTELYIVNSKENDSSSVKVDDICRNASFGQAYDYVIMGNSKDGYTLH